MYKSKKIKNFFFMISFKNTFFQVEEIAARKGVVMDFVDLWEFRSRDVRGSKAEAHL